MALLKIAVIARYVSSASRRRPTEPANAAVCIAEMRYKVAKALGDAAAKIKSGDQEEARPGLEALLEETSALVADMQASTAVVTTILTNY